jgi:putative transposase
VWADGIYCNIRLGEGDRQCLLVVIETTKDGKRELLDVMDGYRESEQSWTELCCATCSTAAWLRHPSWQWVIGASASGRRWGQGLAHHEASSAAGCTRRPTSSTSCPRTCSPAAKAQDASDLDGARRAKMLPPQTSMQSSWKIYRGQKYPKATECLRRRTGRCCFTFYDFPAEHWALPPRTTNPIESTFATVRHRQQAAPRATIRGGPRWPWPFASCVRVRRQKTWRRLNGSELTTRGHHKA